MRGAKYKVGDVVLAEYCPACHGYGTVEVAQDGEHEGEELPCGECDGFGAWVTEDGSQILALVNDILLKGRKKKSD